MCIIETDLKKALYTASLFKKCNRALIFLYQCKSSEAVCVPNFSKTLLIQVCQVHPGSL